MSLFDYRQAVELKKQDVAFDALIMCASMRADSFNFERLCLAFPLLVAETQARYDAPGGILESDNYKGEPNAVKET